MDEQQREAPSSGGRHWWRLVVPVGLMAAVASGWSGSVDPHVVDVSDKLLHFAFYGLLTGSWAFALAPMRMRPSLAVCASFVLAVGWGVMDESLQSLTEHRDSSWLDAGADVLGAGAAAVVSFVVLLRREGPDAARRGK